VDQRKQGHTPDSDTSGYDEQVINHPLVGGLIFMRTGDGVIKAYDMRR
jgi:hypothetical protein